MIFVGVLKHFVDHYVIKQNVSLQHISDASNLFEK